MMNIHEDVQTFFQPLIEGRKYSEEMKKLQDTLIKKFMAFYNRTLDEMDKEEWKIHGKWHKAAGSPDSRSISKEEKQEIEDKLYPMAMKITKLARQLQRQWNDRLRQEAKKGGYRFLKSWLTPRIRRWHEGPSIY